MKNKKTDYEKNEDKFFRLLYSSINTLLEKFGFEHKIIRPCPRDFINYDGMEKRCDFIGLLDNGDILNLEAHSTPITLKDKKKFFDYASYYSIKYSCPEWIVKMFIKEQDVAESRMRSREAQTNTTSDRIERAGAEFHARLREGFDRLAASEPHRIIRIDASGSPDDVWDRVWNSLKHML